MRRRPVQIFSALLLAVVMLSAAGCGSKKSATTTTTPTTTAETTTAAAATTETTTTAASPTTTNATTSTVSAAAGLGALAGKCKSLQDLGAAFSKAFTGANGDVQKEADIMKQFAAQTPSDIRPDFETIANALSKIAGALKGFKPGSTPDASTLAKLASLQGSIDQQQLQTAEQNIASWAAKNCHS
jgi:hypothetical protein